MPTTSNPDRPTATPPSRLGRTTLLAALLLTAPLAWLAALAVARPGEAPPPPADPRRVISVAPCLTEIVFFLGEGERLVARSDYCDWPDEALSLPKIGGYYDPDIEAILRLEPDLVLCVESQVWLLDRCRELGIPAVGIGTTSCERILQGVRDVGRALGVEAHADEVADGIEARLVALTRPRGPEAPRVLWLHHRDPGTLSGLIGLAPGGHTHELLERAGCVNVLSGSAGEAPQVSRELVLLLRPDVIVDDATYSGNDPAHIARGRALWNDLLRGGGREETRVVFLTNDLPYLPGPRIDEALALMETLLDG
jgi:iron complex transport system substrate-binding protein